MTAILVPACWALCLGMFTSCNQIKIFKFLKLRGGRKLTARCSPWKGILLVSEIVCCSSHRATRVVPRYFNIRGLKCIDHFRTWPLTEQFQSSAKSQHLHMQKKWMGNEKPPTGCLLHLSEKGISAQKEMDWTKVESSLPRNGWDAVEGIIMYWERLRFILKQSFLIIVLWLQRGHKFILNKSNRCKSAEAYSNRSYSVITFLIINYWCTSSNMDSRADLAILPNFN